MEERLEARAVALMVLLTALWGGSYSAIKLGLRDLPVMGSLGLRMMLAAGILGAWTRWRAIPIWYGRRANLFLLAAAILFIFTQLAVYVGTNLTTAGRASVFFNTQPFFVLFLLPLFAPGEAFTRRKLVGTTLAFGGVLLLFIERLGAGAPGALVGDLIVLGGALAWGSNTVILKRFPREIHPVTTILWGLALSTLPAWVLHLLLEREEAWRFTLVAVLALLYLVGVAAGSFAVYTWLVQRYPAIRLNSFIFLSPVFGVLLGWLLLGEPLSLAQAGGVLLVGCGIWLVVSLGRRLPSVPVVVAERHA